MNIRLPTTEEHGFIYSSWLRSYRNSNYAKDILNEEYYEGHKEVIKAALDADRVWVCDIDGILVGFVAGDSQCLDFCYVKQVFRKNRIAESLVRHVAPQFKASITTVSHLPKNAREATIKFKLLYSPYYLLRG